jgi:Asp/Glu/hydantoin racemase
MQGLWVGWRQSVRLKPRSPLLQLLSKDISPCTFIVGSYQYCINNLIDTINLLFCGTIASMIDLRIALIHATPLAAQPVATAFASLWPQAQCMNLLDDMLSIDLAKVGTLNEAMTQRMVGLARYAKSYGAQGILFTCSAFGPAIDRARHEVGIPTLKPNEAMFDAALAHCAELGRESRIGLLTTFAPAATAMAEELKVSVNQSGLKVHIESGCAPEAMSALNSGDTAKHDALIVENARKLADCDVLLLGQFSMARAKALVEATTGIPTLTSPESAVKRLMAELN